MNYSTDRPIETGKQDLLGRSSFSNQLGKAIYEYNGKDGLVIGLFGKWGTGKTSVINMAINEINRLAENDENKPMIMKFAPWNYSNKDNLISLFFQSLKNKIDLQDNEELKKKVGKALNDYSGAFDALSFVPIVGSGVAAILKTLAQAQGANLMQCADLDKTREILENALIKANKKIIIVIDDIDRLTNSQIRDVFQLVKQVADFPNVIYVLAMDREVVRNALTEVHNIDGNEYLEKIIQVPFELPELRKSKLHNIFFTKLNQIINDIPDEVVWDNNYWSNVFRNCIEPYINTLRDVNRLINIFQFRYGMLYQETSFEDMVGITTLEVLEPELYKWICNNKDAVCGGFMHGFLSNSDNKPDYRKLYHDEFERLGIDPDLAINCVSTMFPVFAKNVKEYQYNYQPMSDIRGKMRVAHEGRFELYFMFDLDDIKVSRSIINACIYEFDKDRLSTVIEEINKQGNIVYFLEEIRSLVDKIPYKRLDLIASVILSLQGGFKDENSIDIFTRSACDIAEYLANNIIKRLKTEEEKYDIIRSTVENINKTGLGMMARIINRIELAYGRLAGNSEKKEEQIISLNHLEELEKIYVARIRDIDKSESVLDMNEFNFVFYLWECLDKDGVEKCLKGLFKSEVNKLKFICAMASKWNGTNGSGWSFYSKNYSEYVSQDEIYDMIQSFDKNKLDEFTEVEQIKLASFTLNYNKHEMNHVNEQEALKLVNEWKTGKEE
ncbi:MAG: NTPase [Coprobacillus sp.]|nr:NTPase [Coprobacillus sp.]